MRLRGPIAPRRVSGARMAALASGNVDELLRINRAEFGGHVMMADADDDDDDDKHDSDSKDDPDDKGKGTGSDGADDPDDDEDDRLEKLRKRMQAADRRREEAERKLREREDADKDEVTKAKEKAEEMEKQVESLKGEISTLRLQNAFLTANTHPWHDPDDALDVAQRKGYLEDVVNEDGEISKKELTKALDRLAKEKSYLVKSDKKVDDEPGTPSGEPAGGRSDNQKDDKAKEEARRRRFPVLNR